MNSFHFKDRNKPHKTAAEWTNFYKIKFINFAGFPSKESFDTEQITAEEFLNLAANCSIEPPHAMSRREASRLKSELINNRAKDYKGYCLDCAKNDSVYSSYAGKYAPKTKLTCLGCRKEFLT